MKKQGDYKKPVRVITKKIKSATPPKKETSGDEQFDKMIDQLFRVKQ